MKPEKTTTLLASPQKDLRGMSMNAGRVHTKNFNHFSRTVLDFQGLPTRNIISQIVQKRTFPVYSKKALTLELFASPTSLHFSVHLS